MSDNPNEIAKKAQSLVSHVISEQVRAAQRYYDLAMRYGKGELSPQAMYNESLRFATQETSRYAGDLAMLSLNYYSEWFALSQRYTNRFLEVLGSQPPSQTTVVANDIATAPGTVKRVEMELHAPIGQEAVRSFVLENKRGGTADISFDISDFSGPADSAPFSAPLQIDPPQFSLAAGQESTVTLRLVLQPGYFIPGERYHATVVVRGYDGLELGLTAWADTPDQSSVDTNSAVPDSSTGQQPRRSRSKSS